MIRTIDPPSADVRDRQQRVSTGILGDAFTDRCLLVDRSGISSQDSTVNFPKCRHNSDDRSPCSSAREVDS